MVAEVEVDPYCDCACLGNPYYYYGDPYYYGGP